MRNIPLIHHSSKFLLSLDHSDPMFLLLSIDVYAIRSRSFKFLRSLVERIKRNTFSHGGEYGTDEGQMFVIDITVCFLLLSTHLILSIISEFDIWLSFISTDNCIVILL